MLDILSLDPRDKPAVTYLADLLQDRFTADQRRQLLADLDAWNAAIPPAALNAMQTYHRMQQRGAFVPAIARAYLATMAELAVTDG